MKKNKIYALAYLSIWIFPMIIFVRDFFHMQDIKGIDYIEIIDLLKMSLVQGGLSVIFSTLIAVIPAYYISYRRDRISQILEGLIFIPFFFPAVSTVVAFTLFFNLPYIKELGVLYSLKGIIIANVFYNSPIMIKYISQGVRNIPKNILEAGRLDGLNERTLFFKIKLPLILPQVYRGMFLVFLYTFSSFGIVLALGGIRFWNLEVGIATTLLGDADFSKALILGGLQFLVLVSISMIGEKVPTYELSGEPIEKKVGNGVKIYSVIYLAIECIVLLIGIVYGFFNYYTGKFSFSSFLKLFSAELNSEYHVLEALGNSMILAGVTPVFVIIFTYLILKNYSKITGVIIFSTMGFSSAFLGIVLIYLNILYIIPLWLLLIFGYFLVTVPIAYSFMYQYVKEFPKDLLDLGKLDSLSSLKSFCLIEFPILKRVFIGTYLQIFAIILGEFTISYTMQLGTDFPIISIVNYSLYSDKKLLEGAALSSLNVLIVALLFYLSNRLTEDKK